MNLKRLSLSQKKVVSPKDLKPKSHKGTSHRAYEKRGKKEKKSLVCQDQKIEESPVQRAESGSPEVAKGSGSLRRVA